jgi:hypothetical protein
MTISLAGFHLGSHVLYIRHDEAQLHSTWGALGQTRPKSIIKSVLFSKSTSHYSCIETVSIYVATVAIERDQLYG